MYHMNKNKWKLEMLISVSRHFVGREDISNSPKNTVREATV